MTKEESDLIITEQNKSTEEILKAVAKVKSDYHELQEENAVLEKRIERAKELLERLLITSCNSDVLNLLPNCSEVLRVRVEAEQFLNCSEKPNNWKSKIRKSVILLLRRKLK